jgi:hypothetical protein
LVFHIKFPKYFRLAGRKIPTVALIGGTLGVGAIALALHGSWMEPPVAKQAGRIVMQLQPPALSPDRPSILTGRFEDKKGNPVRIKMGRFIVMYNEPGKQPTPVRGGLIGPFAYQFRTVIDTKGLKPGNYTIRIDDHV